MDFETFLDAASFSPMRLSLPDAWVSHIPFASWLIRAIKPSVFVELGTHSGNSYLAFCQAIKESGIPTRCYAVDTWRGDEHTGFYGEEVFVELNAHHAEHYSAFSRLLRMTFDEAGDYFSDGSIELLHIDGCHTYEAVKHDFETWLPKLAPHAVVLFHDTNVREREFSVWKIWEELCARYTLNLEFTHIFGLGVLQITPGKGSFKLPWLRQDSLDRRVIVEYFTALGLRVLEQFRLQERKQQVQALTEQMFERDGQVQALDEQVQALNTQLREITMSKAWRATMLLRRSSLAKKILNSLLLPFTIFRTYKIKRDLRLILNSIYFDEEWYLAHNPDVVKAEIDPARHYLLYGGFEDRDPGPNFSSTGYLRTFEDVKKARTNPLVHYWKYLSKGRTGRKSAFANYLKRFFAVWQQDGTKAAWQKGFEELLTKTKALRGGFYSSAEAYQKWITISEPTRAELKEQRQLSDQLPQQPLISIVVLVYNPTVAFLKDMLQSVVQQTYPNWELCIANGDSRNRPVKKILAEFAIKDKRIRVTHLNQNLGIAGNTNAAISMANGEYVAFLDYDDILAPFALFECVSLINEDPGTDIFFSDEDKISKKGERYEPFFKPGFSPDLLRGVNYMCHFFVVRKSLGDQIGWLRNDFDGAQDYDFVLRAMEKTKKIVRIPKILYHWRSIPGSAASGEVAKLYVKASAQEALREHLQRTGLSGKVESNSFHSWYNIRYDLPKQPLISIIIPNHDHADDLKLCVNSIIEKSTYSDFEILVVENNSRQADTFSLYEQFKKMNARISIIEWKHPFNYSEVNNWAAQEAKGKILLFLNNDIEVISPDWLEQMLMHALRPEIGTVGAKLYYPNGLIQHAGVIVGFGGVAGHGHKNFPRNSCGYHGQLFQVRNVAANTAACVMIRRQVFEEVSGFDEKYILAFGDVDFCLKIHKKGYLNLWTPYAELYHHESKTRGFEETLEQQERFRSEIAYFKHKWADWLQKGDPFYNPNLSLDHEDFRINLATRK